MGFIKTYNIPITLGDIFAIAGKKPGGPAKVAVISSALCGMVSGSSVGNTVTTGSVTIPLMKKTGYPGEFAGAVEAAASTGGQIMPPIMGAAAFIMAQFLGVGYAEIAKAALIPALLYYLAVGFMVHMEAKRLGLEGIPKERLPHTWYVLRQGGYLLMDEHGHLTLTPVGVEIAEKIFERHTVLSRLLIRLGVSEETATADACKLEHAISDESFEAIKRYMADLLSE